MKSALGARFTRGRGPGECQPPLDVEYPQWGNPMALSFPEPIEALEFKCSEE